MRAHLLCLALAGLGAAYTAHALESDREQPIRLSADTVEVNQKTGVSKYRGHVVLIQGTLRIEAAEVRVNTRENEIVSVSAKGRPLTFQQKMDRTGELVKASARRMEYHAQRRKVVLYDRVTFRQGADVLNSAVVHYNLATTQLTADGGKGAERVHGVIQPKRKPTAAPATGKAESASPPPAPAKSAGGRAAPGPEPTPAAPTP